tara:strand:+ start:1302 stop:1958 length:657 start_codon:yes stop_codon:yes gene_type:complete
LDNFYTSHSKYLLALHSCSESFAIAVKDIENPKRILKYNTFNIGHSLSNKLFSCVETLIPQKFWKDIIRITVAKGPGSYTSTRLSLSMSRAIAQQINCSLDAVSSFHIMAARLQKDLNPKEIYDPFWITDLLPRRGIIAGKYKLIKIHKKSNFYQFSELITPKIIKNIQEINPSIKAFNNIEEDIISLMSFSEFYHESKVFNNWIKALPIYPTSPIQK